MMVKWTFQLRNSLKFVKSWQNQHKIIIIKFETLIYWLIAFKVGPGVKNLIFVNIIKVNDSKTTGNTFWVNK